MSRNDAGARHSRARESGVNKSRRRSTSEPNLSTAVEKSGPWNKGRKLRPITQKARADFLDGLAKGLTVRLAAERAGRAHTRRFYELRNEDEEFAAAWTEAVEQGTQLLEDELRQRAVDGWDEWSTSLIASSKGNTSDSRTRRAVRAPMLFTVGYERKTPGSLLETLCTAGIERVVDVGRPSRRLLPRA